MKVYILEEYVHYQVSRIEGVFATRESARAEMIERTKGVLPERKEVFDDKVVLTMAKVTFMVSEYEILT